MTIGAEAAGSSGEFVFPKEARWGLEPDEQVALFGNPRKLDKYSDEAFLVMQEKLRLAAKYLAGFMPDDTVPKEWKTRYAEALQRQQQLNDDLGSRGVIFPESPQEFIMSEGINASYGFHTHRASDREAVLATIQTSALDDSTFGAAGRKEYIGRLLTESDNFSGRGERGGSTWSDLPVAPWGNREDGYPLEDVLNKAEFGLDWQEKGRMLFDPKEPQWGLTIKKQRLLFGDPSDIADMGSKDIERLHEVKLELAIKYLAHFLPDTPEWTDRLREIRENDAKLVAEQITGTPDKAITIRVSPVRETAIRRDIDELGVDTKRRNNPLCEGAFREAFDSSLGDGRERGVIFQANYVRDLVAGELPPAPWRVLSQDYPVL